MIRKFKWSRWVDQFKNMFKNITEREDNYEDDDEDDEHPTGLMPIKPSLVMHTPMGLVPVPMLPGFASDNLDFWILHTNFNITHKLIDLTATVDGIASVDPMTRYSIRIGIPKSGLFNINDVQLGVEKSILAHFYEQQNLILSNLPANTSDKIKEVRTNLDKKYIHWTIMILPNGNMEVVTSNDKDDHYKNKVRVLCTAAQMTGSNILTSDD